MSSSPKSSGSADPTLRTARSGALYAQIGSTLLHSAYDPEREAERFIEAELGAERPATLLVAGETLGYLSRAASRRFPQTRVIPLYYHRFFAHRAEHNEGWNPESRDSIERFLERSLSELDVEGMRLIEWPPCSRAYPETSSRVLAAVGQCVRELNGSLVTTSALGARWLRNSLVNLLTVERAVRFSSARATLAAIVAASGPSLAESIPHIAAVRDRVLLLALPSSIRALCAAGMQPDLVVSTDGSYWASLHLAELRGVPVAAAISGCRAAATGGSAALLLSQGALFETELLAALGARATEVAPNGTVAMTALELAGRLTTGPVVFAGLDFQFRDIREHVRPHTFDSLWAQAATRVHPEYGTIALRAAERLTRRATPAAERPSQRVGAAASTAARSSSRAAARQPLSLATYAGWLARQAEASGRIYRLRPSSVAVPGLPELSDPQFRALALSAARASAPRSDRLAVEELGLPSPSDRRASVARCMERWLGELAAARAMLARDADRRAIPKLGEHTQGLLYLLDTRGCIESRRRARLQGEREATISLIDSIERASALLDELQGRYVR